MVDLDELARLERAATPGPWDVGGWSDRLVTNRDRALICAARTALPALLALARAGERLATIVDEHAWRFEVQEQEWRCPVCDRLRSGHAPDCALAAALAAWQAAREGR